MLDHSREAYRSVRLFKAAEAEGRSTSAHDIHGLLAHFSSGLYCMLTARCWTPHQLLAVFYKATQCVLAELGLFIRAADCPYDVIRDLR